MPSAWSYSRLMMMDGMQDLTILNKVSIRNILPWQDDEKNSPARVKMVLLDGPMTPSATIPAAKFLVHIMMTNVTAKKYVILIKKYHRKNTRPTRISCLLSKGPGSGKKTACVFAFFSQKNFSGGQNSPPRNGGENSLTHSIHVWYIYIYIYLHLP